MKKILITVISLVLCVCFAVIPAAALTVIEEKFDQANPGDDPLTLPALYNNYEWLVGNWDSGVDIVSGEGGNVLKFSGYAEIHTIDYIPAEYTFSFAIKTLKTSTMTSVFVRGERAGALQKLNRMNKESMQVFNFYEWDWYAENGGRGPSSMGGSGLSISFYKSCIGLRIKKYAEDSLTVTSDYCTVPYPENVEPGQYIKIKITDDAKRINIFVEGELTAYAELSDEKVSYESDGTGVEYYKNAKLYDKDGKLLIDVDDTRMHYKGSLLAVATRNENAFVDDLRIVYGDGAIEHGDEAVAEDTTADTDTEQTGDVAEPSDSQSDPVQTTDDSGNNNTPKNSNKKLTVILIAAAVDVVIIAALAFVILKKKK